MYILLPYTTAPGKSPVLVEKRGKSPHRPKRGLSEPPL